MALFILPLQSQISGKIDFICQAWLTFWQESFFVAYIHAENREYDQVLKQIKQK